ncbi:MAG: lipoyl(octanoyl) transferase LipB [Gammaproteobacteria bacterium]|nr:lipoyl(octanoyl) transferase LipB [Gammaproteobacteria bacterium]
MSKAPLLTIRQLGIADYLPVYHAMRDFTAQRQPDQPDELWLLQHPSTFTRGLNSRSENLLNPGSIPVVAVDRGGDVTYHGPGQWVLYLLVDLRRRHLGIRDFVTLMETGVLNLLASEKIPAHARPEAPGVYVANRKIASLGLRVRRQGCYHGLSLNVAMDLTPYQRINPCGYAGLKVTDMQQEGSQLSFAQIGEALLHHTIDLLSRHPATTPTTPAEVADHHES